MFNYSLWNVTPRAFFSLPFSQLFSSIRFWMSFLTCNKHQTGDPVSSFLRHVFTENIYNNFLSANHNYMWFLFTFSRTNTHNIYIWVVLQCWWHSDCSMEMDKNWSCVQMACCVLPCTDSWSNVSGKMEDDHGKSLTALGVRFVTNITHLAIQCTTHSRHTINILETVSQMI